MKTQNKDGEAVRGFQVLLKTGKKILSLPCKGEPLYTGEEALRVMETYRQKRPKIQTRSMTEGLGGVEQLTIEEMKELYA